MNALLLFGAIVCGITGLVSLVQGQMEWEAGATKHAVFYWIATACLAAEGGLLIWLVFR